MLYFPKLLSRGRILNCVLLLLSGLTSSTGVFHILQEQMISIKHINQNSNYPVNMTSSSEGRNRRFEEKD